MTYPHIENEIRLHFRSKAKETSHWRVLKGLKQGSFSRLIRDVDKSNDSFFERKTHETIRKWRATHSLFALPYELAVKIDPSLRIQEDTKSVS